MEDSEKTNDLEQGNGLSLIDVCSEDDSLFKSPLRDPPGHHFSETQEHSNVTNVEDSTVTFEQTDQVPQLLESPEPERAIRNGKYNLRKSLAWDSAFFTNAGVLDPEELSCMIGGVEKGAKTLLSGIQEDLQRSTESMSSLESDNLTLESLEADLFEDIRASIQKSSKLSKVANSSNNSRLGAAETQTIPSSKIDLPSQSKDMPKPTSKKPFVSKLGSGKTPKQPSVCPEIPKRTATSGVATQSGPKPPKVLGNGSPMSSLTPKRASLSSERTRKEMDNANGLTASGRGTSVPKISAISSSRSNAPRPVPIRSSMLGSSVATKINPRSSCSSISSTGSASSDNKSISSLNSIKRKVDLRTANVPSSGLTLKPMSRPKSNNTAGTSRLSAQLKSVTKASSRISPASSISDWSSESSSSTSTANQMSSSGRASLDSSKDVSIESDIPQVVSFGSNDLGAGSSSSRNGSQGTGMLGRGIKKALTGTTTYPALGKPSGLRLPSPKIGFFDGAKSLVRTPNGSTQSSPSGVSHRVEAGHTSPSGNLSRDKMGKLQPARAVAVKGNTKHDTQQSASGTKLKSPPRDPSTASKKTSNASRSTTNSPATSRKVQNKISLKTKGENHSKPVEIETKEPDTAMHRHSNPKVSSNVEDGVELKSCTPQELSHGCMNNNNASGSEDDNISLEPNGENHVEANKEVASVEPDIATHNLKFSLNVQDSNRNGSLEDTRIPLAVRDSFCNMDDSRNDTTGSTEVEEKTTAATFSFSEGNRAENS